MEEAKVSLPTRIGALSFVILSVLPLYYSLHSDLWSILIDGLTFSTPFLVLALTYFIGGTTTLIDGKQIGMKLIFIVNVLASTLSLSIFLLFALGILNDAPSNLKGMGLGVVSISLITILSWRLHQYSLTQESD